ncbi:MAG: DUF1643 domain-containing protein [Lentisphaeraceae bacterium]|nr:DUF1643 domain-containing protein [Lentisphaeraceae bacterium]
MSQPELEFNVEGAVFKDAHITRCEKFRYWLTRKWNNGDNYICWIMLNPSTADASNDDPTIRRCISFSKLWGFDGLYVVNLFSFRATDPKELKKAGGPVGEHNNEYIKFISSICSRVVCAWGNHGKLKDQYKTVCEILYAHCSHENFFCLGKTGAGQPKHPLYVESSTKLIRYKAEDKIL